jgi:hypothetical protein
MGKPGLSKSIKKASRGSRHGSVTPAFFHQLLHQGGIDQFLSFHPVCGRDG